MTTFCSSIRKARTIRSWTQLAHRDPPYARWTVFLGRETVAYSRGRRAGIPASLVPQSWRLLKKRFRDAGLGLTYTALGGSALLLDVEVTELATGGLQCLSAGHQGMCASTTDLDNANLLALGVVRRATPLRIVSLHAICLSSPPSEWKTCVSGCDVRR